VGPVVLLGALAIAIWLALPGDGPMNLSPPSPERVPDEPLAYALPTSYLDVPIHVDVDLLLEAVESRIPREWVEEDVTAGDGDTVASMAFTRGPFSASFDGGTAYLATTIAYAFRATHDLPLLPDINMACGIDDDRPAPRMDVQLEAPIRLDSQWTLVSDTRVGSVGPTTTTERDQCRVTLFDMDITERITNGMRSFLIGHTPAIDSMVAAVDVRADFERWWGILAEPVRLDDSVWLQLRPESIGRGHVVGRGSVVEISANLGARPAIVIGSRPPSSDVPLPPLGEVQDPGPFEATVDVLGDYDEIGDVLTSEFRGTRFERAGRSIRLRGVTLSGIGANQISVAVAISGDVEGTLYLVGTPAYDTTDGFVRLPDLAMSLTTSDLLVAGASWLLDAEIESRLRDQLRWPVDGGVEWAADRLEAGLNATLGDGLRLRGSVGSLEILNVHARAEGLLVRARTTGEVELLVEQR